METGLPCISPFFSGNFLTVLNCCLYLLIPPPGFSFLHPLTFCRAAHLFCCLQHATTQFALCHIFCLRQSHSCLFCVHNSLFFVLEFPRSNTFLLPNLFSPLLEDIHNQVHD